MDQVVLAASADEAQDAAGDELVAALKRIDVPFLAGGPSDGRSRPIAPGALLVGLASSPEARLRLAMIPLLLRHPQFTVYVHSALEDIPAPAASGFKCYYVAAALLQRKYWARLQTFGMPAVALLPFFFAELAIPASCAPDDGLKLLADRQVLLSGRHINWQGTYEHAAKRFLTHMERRSKWKV